MSTSKCSRVVEVSVEDTEGLLGFSGSCCLGVRGVGKVREGVVRMVSCTCMHVHASLVFVRMKHSLSKGRAYKGYRT